MELNPGGSHVHHHGLLAGLGAGAVAVLAAAAFLASVWHRVSGTVAEALDVIVWALVAAVVAAVAFVVGFLFLRLRHHAANPETLTRQRVRAEVVRPAEQESPAIPAPAPVPALPSPVVRNWNLHDPDTAAAVVRGVAEGATEGNRS